MSEQKNNQVSVLALSVHHEMGESFVKAVCGDETTCTVGEYKVAMDVLAGDPRLNAAWDDHMKSANGVLILTRFLDVITLDKIKSIYRRLPTDTPLALAMVIVRENDEGDFKMSCPVCGQKLWVRDNDAGKRGRCPNCKKAFTLPDQVSHVRAQLALPDSIPVLRINSADNATAKEALTTLVSQLSGDLIEKPDGLDENVLKQSTIRVQINPEDV